MINSTEFEQVVKMKTYIIQNKIDAGRIHKSRNGNYKYSEQTRSSNKSGKDIRVYGSGKDAEKCAISFAKCYFKTIEKMNSTIKPHSLAEVAREWYANEIEQARMNSTSKKDYKRYVEKEIIPALGDKTIDALKECHYNDFMNRYQGQGEAKLKNLRLTLKRILKFANKNDYIKKDNFDIKLPEFEKTKKRDALPQQILELLTELYRSGDTQSEDFIILLMTGMRIKEATQLKYSDIDFEKRSIKIRESKTENGIREIPIADFIVEILKRRIKEAQENNYKTECVFRQKLNPEKALTVQGFEENFNRCLRKMDILNGAKIYRNRVVETTLSGVQRKPSGEKKKVRSGLKYPYTPYQFRHTYATLLDEFDIKQSIIKDLIGHSQANDLTNSTYTHRSTERRHRALKPFFDVMNDFINKGNTDLKTLIDNFYDGNNN